MLKQALDFYNAANFAVLKPVTTTSISDIEAAIRSYSDDSSDGKGVVSFDPKASLKVIRSNIIEGLIANVSRLYLANLKLFSPRTPRTF